MKISIAIPCYEMYGRGSEMLQYSLDMIKKQGYSDYEVVIADHSRNDDLFQIYNKEKKNINIKYVRNKKNIGSLASNLNCCINNCAGNIIKFIMQDDYLLDENSLGKIAHNFDNNKNWLVSSYYHTKDRTNLFNLHVPSISSNMLFVNLIGTPTCLTIKNEKTIYFDEKLNWFVDSDYYKRLFKKFGNPVFLEDPTAVQLLWEGQSTNTIINNNIIKNEEEYLYKKYGIKI